MDIRSWVIRNCRFAQTIQSVGMVKTLLPQLAMAAQRVYEEWEASATRLRSRYAEFFPWMQIR